MMEEAIARSLLSHVAVINEMIASPLLDELEEILTDQNTADALGPIVDPTRWIASRSEVGHRESRDLLRQLVEYRKKVIKTRERVHSVGAWDGR